MKRCEFVVVARRHADTKSFPHLAIVDGQFRIQHSTCIFDCMVPIEARGYYPSGQSPRTAVGLLRLSTPIQVPPVEAWRKPVWKWA